MVSEVIKVILERIAIYLGGTLGIPIFLYGLSSTMSLAKEMIAIRKGKYKVIKVNKNKRATIDYLKPDGEGNGIIKGKTVQFPPSDSLREYVYYTGVLGNTPTMVYDIVAGKPLKVNASDKDGELSNKTVNRLMEIAESKGMHENLQVLKLVLFASLAAAAAAILSLIITIGTMNKL